MKNTAIFCSERSKEWNFVIVIIGIILFTIYELLFPLDMQDPKDIGESTSGMFAFEK